MVACRQGEQGQARNLGSHQDRVVKDLSDLIGLIKERRSVLRTAAVANRTELPEIPSEKEAEYAY